MKGFRAKKLRLPKVKNVYNAFAVTDGSDGFTTTRFYDGNCLTFVFDWVQPLSG
jgi:hypothetical protein